MKREIFLLYVLGKNGGMQYLGRMDQVSLSRGSLLGAFLCCTLSIVLDLILVRETLDEELRLILLTGVNMSSIDAGVTPLMHAGDASVLLVALGSLLSGVLFTTASSCTTLLGFTDASRDAMTLSLIDA